MGTNSLRRLEAGLAGISSSLAKLRTDARRAAQMILVCFAVDAMIPRIILGIWSMSACPWEIVAVVIAGIRKPGDYQCIAPYILSMMGSQEAKIRESHLYCLPTSSSRFG